MNLAIGMSYWDSLPTQTNRDYQGPTRHYWGRLSLIGLGRLPLRRLLIPT